jgi:hypothetical protein
VIISGTAGQIDAIVCVRFIPLLMWLAVMALLHVGWEGDVLLWKIYKDKVSFVLKWNKALNISINL